MDFSFSVQHHLPTHDDHLCSLACDLWNSSKASHPLERDTDTDRAKEKERERNRGKLGMLYCRGQLLFFTV